ncbi:mitochodrial transcription termination factor, partial [Tanacetum coccineum]
MSFSEATLNKKLGIFRSFGWTEDEIVRMSRSSPFCLTTSEGTIKAKLEWFKEEIGYGGEYLSTHPNLLLYSLEKRVVPRYKVLASLKEKNVLKSKLSLCSVVALSEEKFVRDFVLPYCEVVPNILLCLISVETWKAVIGLLMTPCERLTDVLNSELGMDGPSHRRG